MNNDIMYKEASEDEESMTPSTPAIKEDAKRDKDDSSEILLGDEDLAEDETDDMEEEYEW